MENMPPQLRAAVLLSAWGELRWGEVAELRRKELSGNVGHVTRAVVRLPGEGPETVAARRRPRFVVGDPKGEAGIRADTLPSAIMPAIQAHLAAMEARGRLNAPCGFCCVVGVCTRVETWRTTR